MKRYKVTTFFSYRGVCGGVVSDEVTDSGERANDSIMAESEEQAKELHLAMVKENEPNLVEVFSDKTIVEEYVYPPDAPAEGQDPPSDN